MSLFLHRDSQLTKVFFPKTRKKTKNILSIRIWSAIFFPDRPVSLPCVRKYLRDNERHYLAKKVRTTTFPMTTNLTLGKLLKTALL